MHGHVNVRFTRYVMIVSGSLNFLELNILGQDFNYVPVCISHVFS